MFAEKSNDWGRVQESVMQAFVHKHIHTGYTLNDVFKVDPSRTLTLRKAFVAEVNRRFRWLKRVITGAVVDKDVFGLKEEITPLQRKLSIAMTMSVDEALATVKARQFAFTRTSAKVDGFMDWLNQMEERSVLEIVHRPGAVRGMEEAWSDHFIQSSYQKGILRGRQELRKAGADIPSFGGRIEDEIGARFNQPFHSDRVGVLYTRCFNELKGITAAMDQQISSVLAQGLVEGRNPRELARWLTSTIEMPRVTVKIPGVGFRRLTAIQRARTMARTEVIRAHHQANIQEYRSAGIEGVKVQAEWSTAGHGVCEICASLEGKIFSLDEIEGMIPVHPNCILDGQVKIYSSEGWMPIRDIKVGDLVLTHKKRFKKVTQLHRNLGQCPEAVTIQLQARKDQIGTLSLTSEHPVLVGDGEIKRWMSIGRLNSGYTINFLADECRRCGKPVPYFREYCSHSCLSKDITDKQWADPEHRKNISVKASAQMKREYALGIRDKDKITRKANEKTRQLAKEGKFVFQRPEIREIIRQVTNTSQMRKDSSERMKKNNPSKDPFVRDKMTKSLNNLYELHPEKRLNARMSKFRKSGKMTWIEERMASLLDKIGVDYVFQYPILRYNVDFVIPALRIVIECDGEYWHKDKEKDDERQKRIENEGWFVLRYTGRKINQCLDEIEGELARVFGNHRGEFGLIPMKIDVARRWKAKRNLQLYNLSVQDDESYIANGFAIHNCRCVALPYRKEWDEKK